jgi:UPF0176 protein
VKNLNINFELFSFYRFIKIHNKEKIKLKLDRFVKKLKLRGTILVSDEGINGSISGNKDDLFKTIKFIKQLLCIRKIHINKNSINFLPFNRLKIRLKKEIISLGLENVKVNKFNNNHLEPREWNNLINKKDTLIIDVRNEYEISIGKFANSINPQTKSFREFPKKLNELKIKKNINLALYCTGGIRCEKASILFKQKGFKKIYQLKGGILNYLESEKNSNKKSLWNGECFVFDNRVTVNRKLQTGKYLQCHGCRHPITLNDTKLKSFIKGVSCKHCYKKRSKRQIINSSVRQNQIEIAEDKGLSHPFKKIFASNQLDITNGR